MLLIQYFYSGEESKQVKWENSGNSIRDVQFQPQRKFQIVSLTMMFLSVCFATYMLCSPQVKQVENKYCRALKFLNKMHISADA